jgi:hypothetical protein
MKEETKSSVAGYVGLFLIVAFIATAMVVRCSKKSQDPPKPSPSPSAEPVPSQEPSAKPDPVEPIPVEWYDVLDPSSIKGRWTGKPGLHLVVSEREKNEGSPYPWRLMMALPSLQKPMKCGFFTRTHPSDPVDPEKGFWRIAYCEGADLPADAGVHVKRLMLRKTSQPTSVQVCVDNRYCGEFDSYSTQSIDGPT